MTERIDGKTVLITGASRGIGRAIAEKLALNGAAFIGVHYGGDQKAADDVVAMIGSMGIKSSALHADFSSGTKLQAENLWKAFETEQREQTGIEGLDILINCAGIAPQASLDETTDAIFEHVMAINLKAPFFLIQAAGKYIKEGGRIINFSSALTRISAPTRAVYAASKGAINVLTLALAPEFAPRSITVNAVAPGVIDTDMNSSWLHTEEGRASAEEISAFSRVGQAEDVADIVAFLASDRSRWITGQVIDASGGSQL